MNILAIDPGQEQSGWVVFDGQRVLASGISDNSELLDGLIGALGSRDVLAIEMVSSYGMPVGKEIFETCVWIGRFIQASPHPDRVCLTYRTSVKVHLCGTARAKDPNIRQALIDLVGPSGTKKNPGPTYGVKGDIWSALAVAVYARAVTKPPICVTERLSGATEEGRAIQAMLA